MIRLYLTLAILFGVLLTSCPVKSQDLARSRRSSYCTYIYKISNNQAYALFRDINALDTTFLTNLHDFYPTDSAYKKKLPVGHYVAIHAVGGELHGELLSMDPVDLKVLNNHRDLVLVLYDTLGQEVPSAEVTIGSKRVAFDKRTQTYRLKKSNRRGIIKASYRGHVSYFEIGRQYNNSFAVRAGKRVLATFPVNHLASPITYVYNNARHCIQGGRPSAPGIYYRVRNIFRKHHRRNTHTGYLVFNQPEYKPADTVRFKAFITTTKGKPYNKPADVYLIQNYPSYTEKKLTSLVPFRRGAYRFEFALRDTLKLQLDRTYAVQLRDKHGSRLIGDEFRYADYELKQNTYTARGESARDGKPAQLFLKGVDSNDMPLFDIRVEILLRSALIDRYYDQEVFVPDTLWRYRTSLEPAGETRIVLPDSVMPKVSLGYEALVTFLNSDNERTDRTAVLEHNHKPFPVTLELKNDSLVVSSTQGILSGKTIVLQQAGAQGRLTREVILPYQEKINAFTDYYIAKYEDGSISLPVGQKPDLLQLFAHRTSDSLFITTENPRKIPFRYFLFKNQKLIEAASSSLLSLTRKAGIRDRYTLSVQYVWAGAPQTRDYTVEFDTRNLTIKLDHAPVVYPGQKALFTVAVNDASGKPVADVDLTAYAITKKFTASMATPVPSFARKHRGRTIINEFTTKTPASTVAASLDHAYWRKTLGLDSLLFYHFLYPAGGHFEQRKPAAHTEFAPFVVSNGMVQKIEVIYVDGQPVYYESANASDPYAFEVREGKREIVLRLSHAEITLPVEICAGEKLIFSIDYQHLPKFCRAISRPGSLDNAERTRLRRYFVPVRFNAQNGYAYIQQGSRYQLLGPKPQVYTQSQLTGPFYIGQATYVEKGGDSLSYTYEPFYEYEFKKNLLKLREANNALPLHFGWNGRNLSFGDHVLTRESIRDHWRRHDERQLRAFKRFPEFKPGTARIGRLLLDGIPKNSKVPAVKLTFVVNLENPSDYSLVPGTPRHTPFHKGRYQVVVIFEDGQFIKTDPIDIQAYGLNYYNLGRYQVHTADTFSTRMLKLAYDWSAVKAYVLYDRELELQQVRTLYYQQPGANHNFDHVVSGRIVDNDGMPIPGVNVIVKGTTVGTATDLDGFYSINCPEQGTLVFSFIGYVSIEQPIGSRHTLDATLQADIQQLSEVVVVGYGMQTSRHMLSASVSSVLSGRIPGVSASTGVPDSVRIQIRGINSMRTSENPLIVLDGQIVSLDHIDENSYTAIEVLKSAQATALYGSRGAAGVILLSKKPGATRAYLKQISQPVLSIPEETPGNALRRNFRDYAFWKPALHTDKQGKAIFEATFPDDITGWNAYVLGMGSRRRTGQTSTTIQSFKPLMAQIAQPHFLVEGDRATAIGKITNYSQEKIALSRTIEVDDRTVSTTGVTLEHSSVDSIHLEATGKDSLAVKYTVTYKNYKDGELRKLPVYRKGVEEATGTFALLEGDTTLSLSFDKAYGPVKLYAEADLVDVLLDEVQQLKRYPYECNEQSASRLKVLLLEKQICAYRGEKFTDQAGVTRMIRKLVANQNKDGSWSWWKNGEGEVWITLHVARALLRAEKEGIPSAFDKELLINYLQSRLAGAHAGIRPDVLQFLAEQGQAMNVREIADSLAVMKYKSVHDRLEAQRLLQTLGQKVDWPWIKSIRSETAKGNYYWGEEKTHVLDNAVINTLIVYNLLSKENANHADLIRMRNYFLERRKKTWRNTYESSLILEAILPGLLRQKAATHPVKLVLSGGITKTIDQFPFTLDAGAMDRLSVSKSGNAPVYFTAYQEHWNATPARIDKDFVVDSYFNDNAYRLNAGKPVPLHVKVEVKRDAEFVMIEVPIPAGCSYREKPQPRTNGEVHREYYHHKTNIYCKYLKKGTYVYTIELLPRYSGNYTLNPAVVECMYFPTIYGRETAKDVKIR